MSNGLQLTLACGDYEIVRALKEGQVTADGIDLTVLTDMDSATRHWRMLRDRAFDIAELSLSSYLMAKNQDHPLTAIPVFLHRRFRHGFIFVNASANIRQPKDLIGRRVGIKTFQATAILWMRGLLEHEYGVLHTEIRWLAEREEDVEFTPADGLTIGRTPPGRTVETMLTEGEIEAVMHPELIDPIRLADPRVRRLFEDYQAVEREYFKRTGIFPIMHVTAIRREIVDANPWVPTALMRALEQAKRLAYERLENPRIVPLAWHRSYWEDERALMGPDPWAYGLDAGNRTNLETAIGYSVECGLISRRPTVDELFVDV